MDPGMLLNLSIALMLLIQTICLGGLKEILQCQQTQLGISVWSQSFPCWPYFARMPPLLTKFLSSERQNARWQMTFKSRQRHAGNSWGWSVRQRDLFRESASSMLTSESWKACKNRNGPYLWTLQIHGLNLQTQCKHENDSLHWQWVTA